MALTQTKCLSYQVELLNAVHNFSTDTFKIALYTSAAVLNAATTVYSATNEVTGAGYVAGGAALTVSQVPIGDTNALVAYMAFANISVPGNVTARGALIYNASKANRAVCVLDFGADKTSTSGSFPITMPAATATTALIRIA